MTTVDPDDLTDRLDELTETLSGFGDCVSAGEVAEIAEKAIETARQAIAAAEESWRNVIATRHMSSDANARLRAVLLAALGETDDGETALIQYVQRLAEFAGSGRAAADAAGRDDEPASGFLAAMDEDGVLRKL